MAAFPFLCFVVLLAHIALLNQIVTFYQRVTMKICRFRFNLYLMLLGAICLAAGCQSGNGGHKKLVSVFRAHLEAPAGPAARGQPVQVFRLSPISLEVQQAPFLTEQNVKAARVIDVVSGFVVEIQLDRQGTFLLEQYTSANVGRHLVLFGAFGGREKQPPEQSRWLAAPLITSRIADGTLTFTPDASRTEADLFVAGLRNVAKKYQDKGE